MHNIPNLLTILRLGLIPVFVLLFYLPVSWSGQACAVVFAIAAITDWLDGYLARRMAWSSAFGAFLDPVADKVMVAVVLVLLVQDNAHWWFAIPAAVIVGREIVVSALREWMAEVGKRTHVAVSIVGKFKTLVQMIALVLLLYREDIGPFATFPVGVMLLYVAAVLTLWSMWAYLRAAWPSLRGLSQSP